jgi:predicted transcriptional regulator
MTIQTQKQAIIEMIQRMPEDASLDDVMYALYVRQAIERGIADADAGRFASDEEVERVLGKRRKSAGE